MKAIGICLLGVILVSACATTNGRRGMGPRPGTPEYAAQANLNQPKQPPPCSTWVNRGRAGGTVGSVIGFVAASALGSPVMGLLYQAAGYGAGFASADKCKKEDVAAAQTTRSAHAADSTPRLSTARITEEELE